MNIIPFDLAQITRNVNRTRAKPGLPASTLNGPGQMHVAMNEPQTFDWQAGVAKDDRAWLVDKPGRTRALTSSRTLAVFGGNDTSGERGVAASLTAHPTGRYDFESENLVCGAQSAAHGGPDDNSAQAGHIVYALQHAQIGRADDAGPQAKGYQEGVAFTQDSRAAADAVIGRFGVRRLTPVECERLQGFEDGWTAWGLDENGERIEMSDSARYRMIGNAVCRAVSDWLDRRIARVMGGEVPQ